MMKDILMKFLKDPIRSTRRAFEKLVCAPFKYGRRDGYDAASYWKDRFVKYGRSLQGVGDEGLSVQENERMYEDAARAFKGIIRERGIDLKGKKVLEIGCGTGFYTRVLKESGVCDYTGMDITDVLFPKLRGEFPGFAFLKGDITKDVVGGRFDLIVMIDVIEHIVQRPKLAVAIKNAMDALADNGLFLISPVVPKGQRHLFYVRFWSLEDIQECLRGFVYEAAMIPFRYESLLSIKKGGR